MPEQIASVSIGTSLDLSGLNRDLERLKRSTNLAVPTIPVKVQVGNDLDKIKRDLERQFRGSSLTIKVKADHSELYELNKHIELKRSHIKDVNAWMGRNPIKPRIDGSELKELGLAVDQLKTKFANTGLKINVSTASTRELEQVGDKITESVGNAVTKSLSQSLPTKLVKGVGGAVSGLIENTFGSVLRGALENVGRELSGGLTKGLTAAFENAMGDTIGSTELLGGNLGKALSKSISKKLPKELKADLQSAFKEALGEADIVTASRSIRGRQRQQQRSATRIAQEEVTLERRDSLRNLRSLQQKDAEIKAAIEQRQAAYERGLNLQERLQFQQRLPGLSEKEIRAINKTLDNVNTAIEGLIQEESQLLEEQEKLAKSIEQARDRVKKTKDAQASITPKEQPKAYRDAFKRLTGGQLAEELIPQLVIDDRALKAEGARAKYSIERNAITVTRELYKAIESGVLNRDQLESLYHELEHGVQTRFGSFKGVQAFKRGDILNKPVKATAKEMRAIAPLIGQYDPSQRLAETDAEIIGRRQADAVIREQQRELRLNQLSSLTGIGGGRYEQIAKQQAAGLKTRLTQTLDLARKSGLGATEELKDFVSKLAKLQSDIDKTIDDIAIAPQDLDTSQIEQLQSNIKSQLQQFTELSKELNQINQLISSKVNIPVNVKQPQTELAIANQVTSRAANASAESVKQIVKVSNTELQKLTRSPNDAVARAKEISASFRTAYAQLKKALAEDNQELAKALAETIKKNADVAKKEIAALTKELGNEAKFGTKVGSQLASTQGQIGRANKLSGQAIAKYKASLPPVPDPWGDEELEAKRLLEVQRVRTSRSMTADEIKQVKELNELLQKSVKAADEFDLAFRQANRNTAKSFQQSTQALDETIRKFEQGVDPTDELDQKVGGFTRSVYNGVKALILLKGALLIAPAMIQLGQQAYQTAKAFDNLERSITYSAGSKSEGVKNLQFIRSEVDRLNAPLQDATEGFNQLAGALAGTKLQGNTQEIFTALNEAALVRQLNPEQRRRLLTGVTQAASKPVLSSEEVNQQIGEALPGAANIFARAYGESPEIFRKNLEAGQYAGGESILKFARQLRIEFSGGVEEAANSTQALENRLANTRIQLERMLGGAVMPFVNTGLKALNSALELVINNADKLALILGALALQQLPAVLATLGKLAQVILPSLSGGLGAATGAIAAFSIKTAALALALKVLSDTYNSFQAGKGIESFAEKNIAQFKRLEEAAAKSGKSIQRTFNDLDNYNKTGGSPLDKIGLFLNKVGIPNPFGVAKEYGKAQAFFRDRSYGEGIGKLNDRIGTTLATPQVTQADAARSRELSKILADPFTASSTKESVQREKDAIDARVKLQKDLLDNLVEGIESGVAEIDAAWARSDLTSEQAERRKAEIRKSLPILQQAQREAESFASGQISLIKLIREQLLKVSAAYTDANTAITNNTSLYQGQISLATAIGGLTPGQSQYAQQILQQRSLESQLDNSRSALGELNRYVQTPDNIKLLTEKKINPQTVGAEELKRLSDLTTRPEEKLLYERLTKIREIEGQVAQVESQLAQSKEQSAQQLYELGKSVDEYLRGIDRQTAELELTVKSNQAQLAIASEKNRLTSKLQGFQANFFSGFVDSLISGLDTLNAVQQAETERQRQLLQNQIQAEDARRQGRELLRQLPDGLPSGFVPQSIPTTPIQIDVNSVNANAGVQQLKGAVEGALSNTRDLNTAMTALGTTAINTGVQIKSSFQVPPPDTSLWSQAIGFIKGEWGKLLAFITGGAPALAGVFASQAITSKEATEQIKSGWKSFLTVVDNSKDFLVNVFTNPRKAWEQAIAGIQSGWQYFSDLVSGSIPRLNAVAPAIGRINNFLGQTISAYIKIIEKELGVNNLVGQSQNLIKQLAALVGVNLLKAFNSVGGTIAEIAVKLLAQPESIEQIRSKVLGLGFDFKDLADSVTKLGESIIGSIGSAVDAVKQKIGEALSFAQGGAQQAQEGLAGALGFGGGGEAGSGQAIAGSGRVTVEYRTGLIPGQNYGAARRGGRKHAGQDFDISGNQEAQSFLGGVVTRVGFDPKVKGYGHYADIYNKALNVVERIAEASQLLVKEGQTIQPGQAIGKGESGTGVIHYEIHTSHDGGRAGFGFSGTTNPVKYLEKLGLVRQEGTKLRVIGGLAPYQQQLQGQTKPTANGGRGGGTYTSGLIGGAGQNLLNNLQGGIPKGLTAKGRRYAQLLNDPEIRALLDTIARAEGADYNMLYGGSKLSNLSQHPNRVVRKPGWIPSSAAGRYQFMNYTWFGRSKQRPGPGIRDVTGVPDFSPTSQDIAAIALLDEAGILGKAAEGNVQGIWRQLGRIWASFEGNPYGQGTPQGRKRSALPYYQNRRNLYQQGGTGKQRGAVLGVRMDNPDLAAGARASGSFGMPAPARVSTVDTGNSQRIASGQAQIIRNRNTQDDQARKRYQSEIETAEVQGQQEQKRRTEQTRQSLNQLLEQNIATAREFRNMGLAIGDMTPLREFQQIQINNKDAYDDFRRKLLEQRRQTEAGVQQAKLTEAELTSPNYQVQPGQNLQEDIQTTRRAIALGGRTLQQIDKIIGQIDDQEKRREKFEKEQFARRQKLQELANRDMVTQEKIAATQQQLRKAQLAQQRNPRDFSQGDPLALQAQIELMQQLLPLDQKRRQLAEELRIEKISPKYYNEAIALLEKQEKLIVSNTEAAKQFGLEDRRLRFREEDFAFLQRKNQVSGNLTQAQLQAAELFQQTRPFDISQGDPAVIRYGLAVTQIEEDRERELLAQRRFQLTNGNRSAEELAAINAKINQAADQRLENAKLELENTQRRTAIEKDRFEFDQRNRLAEGQAASLEQEAALAETYLRRNPFDFAMGDPLTLRNQAERDRILRERDRQILDARALSLQGASPEYVQQVIDGINQATNLRLQAIAEQLVQTIDDRRREEQAFLLNRRQQMEQGQLELTDARAQFAEMYLRRNPFDLSMGDPLQLRNEVERARILQERDRLVLEAQNLITQGWKPEEIEKRIQEIDDAVLLRLQTVADQLNQAVEDRRQEQLDFELGRRQRLQQSGLDVLSARSGFLAQRGFGFQSQDLNRQIAIAQQGMQFDSSLRGLEKLKATGEIAADEFEVLKSNLEAVSQVKLDQIKDEFNTLRPIIQSTMDGLKGFFKGFLTGLKGVISGEQSFGEMLTGIADQMFTSIFDTIAGMGADWLTQQLGGLFGFFPKQAAATPLDPLVSGASGFFGGISMLNPLPVVIAGAPGLAGGFSGIMGANLFGDPLGINNPINPLAGLASSLFAPKGGGGGLGGILSTVASFIPGGNFLAPLVGLLGFSKGGMVPGTDIGRDSVPAILRPGEYVMSRNAVSALGVPTLEAMNNGAIRRYASGGYVQPVARASQYAGEMPQGSGTRKIEVGYAVQRINSINYVTEEQFREGMRITAEESIKRSGQAVIDSAQNSPQYRMALGI